MMGDVQINIPQKPDVSYLILTLTVLIMKCYLL